MLPLWGAYVAVSQQRCPAAGSSSPAEETDSIYFIAHLGHSPSPNAARKGADCESELRVLCCGTLLYH